MAHEHNWYQVLGLQPGATPEEIRRAYRDQVRQTHEDRTQGLPEAEREERGQRYRNVVKAYRILSNPTSRQQFDRRFAPPCSLHDLLLRPSGERVGDQLFARGVKEPVRGEDLLMRVTVPTADWRPGGMLEVMVGREAVRVPVPTDLTRRWLRFEGMGAPGSNGGSAGDLFVHVDVSG